MEKEKQETCIPIHDLFFCAFALQKGLRGVPRAVNDRIAFMYRNDETFKEILKSFYEPQEGFSLTEYIEAMKRIKSLMYQAKQEGRRD